MPSLEIFSEIYAERLRQDLKWGEQNHPNGTEDDTGLSKLAADAARASCDKAFAEGRGTWRHILEEELFEAVAEDDPVKLRGELIQVAAVAVAWIEAIDRANN